MKGIKEVEIDGEKIYLKKSIFGWGIIHPIKENGKINWKNLIAGGSWIKLGITAFFIILLLLAINEVSQIIRTANECLSSSRILLRP